MSVAFTKEGDAESVAADLPELLVKLYPEIKPSSIRVKEA